MSVEGNRSIWPSESAPIEDRKGFYDDINIEIESVSSSGDIPIVMGDLNAKISLVDGEVNATSEWRFPP